MPVGEEAELTNADEAVWKDMLHVAPQELRCRERNQALLVSVCIVLPAESDLLPIERNEPVIADGNAMRIAAQIAEHRFGPAIGAIVVNHKPKDRVATSRPAATSEPDPSTRASVV